MEKIIKTYNTTKEVLVSVVMPVYNAEKYLVKSVISVFEQTYEHIELICVDDGSIDSSLKLLYQLKNNYPNKDIKIISQENAGPAAARNRALDYAKGDYIAFLDSDDYIEPDAYNILVKTALETAADIVVYGGKTFPQQLQKNHWISRVQSPHNKTYDQDDAGKRALFREESAKPFIWLHFIKRELIERKPKLRLNEKFNLGEDQIFIFSYFPRAKKVVFIEDKLYNYRLTGSGSVMNKYNAMKVTKFNIHLGIVKNVLSFWRENGISDSTGEMISYFTNFLYNDFINFPTYLQIEYAKKIVEIVTSQGFDLLYNSDAFDKGKNIMEISLKKDIDVANYIKEFEENINASKNRIKLIMASKAYKMGKMLTPPNKRIDEVWLLNENNKKIF